MARNGSRARWPLTTLALCVLVVQGCAYGRLPQIDPSGEHFFIPGPLVYDEEPRPPLPHHERHQMVKLTLSPTKIIAPVGSEVVFLAAVCGADGCMYANQEVEWMLAPGGAGHFIALGRKSPLDWLVGFSAWPRKVNSSYAIGVTSSRYLCLTRGTPTPADDLPVQRGQAWISLTSPVEGTSHVTAHARRSQLGRARADGDGPLGRRRVRLSAAGHQSGRQQTCLHDNRLATFDASSGRRLARALRDYGRPAGWLCARWGESRRSSDKRIGPGQRRDLPARTGAGDEYRRHPSHSSRRCRCGRRTLRRRQRRDAKDMEHAGTLLRKTGPAHGVVGDTLVYRIEVRNPGDLTSKGVVVTDQLSEGLTFLSSNPPVQPAGGKLQWSLGDLLRGEGRTIEVNLRADRPGTVNNCASAVSAEKLSAQDCATTTVVVQSLRVEVSGPPQVGVGQEFAFEARITNAGDIPATGLLLVDRYDPGLRHAAQQNPIERTLGDLQPGETKRVEIKFIAAEAGPLCNTVEVQAVGGGVLGSGKACVAVAPADGSATPPPAAGAAAPASPAAKPNLVVRKTGPAKLNIGDTAEFKIEVVNQGQGPATNLKVLDHYDTALEADGRFAGFEMDWRRSGLANRCPANR